MSVNAALDQLERSSPAEAASALRALRGTPGLSGAYFERILATYAANPGVARRLTDCWRLVLRYGDDASLAYRAKGVGDRLSGRWLASARAFQRAGEGASTPRERLAYQIGAIDGLAKAGRWREAVDLGQRLHRDLNAMGEELQAARVALNIGNAFLWAERSRDARRWFEAAAPVLHTAGLAVEEAGARLGLSTTHLFGGSPELARQEAEFALSVAAEHELAYIVALSRINLAQASLLQGRADEALDLLLKAQSELTDSPTDLARLQEFLGDAYLKLNLFSEARHAYESSLESRAVLPAVNIADIYLGIGEAIGERNPGEADRHLAIAVRRFRLLGNRTWEAAALIARSELARPKNPHRAQQLAILAIAAAGRAPYHRMRALLAHAYARVAAKADHSTELERAAALLKRNGFLHESWRIHHLRALAAERPLSHYRRMLRSILAARLGTRSVTARLRFLSDKSTAIEEYLNLLLSQPNSRRVAEALDLIRQTRSITLLDEIVTARAVALTPKQAAQLENLRAELRLDEAAEEHEPDVRRGGAAAGVLASRRWIEATHALTLFTDLDHAPAEKVTVLAEAKGQIFAITGHRSERLAITAADLASVLRWMRFELLEPLADRAAPADSAICMLTKLKDGLCGRWMDEAANPQRLCLDSSLWSVPWDAVLGRSTVLCLHPSLNAGPAARNIKEACVWIDEARDLQHASSELAALLDLFPNATVCRTRAECKTTLDRRWDLIHVIGHANHNAENPMFSCLRFSDGPIFAGEIARSSMQAGLVSLSACDTGALSLVSRQEPDGLVRAFLARRARAVLASLWPLDDESASRMFSDVYKSLKESPDVSAALSKARRSVREWREHPYFWAPLALFGGYER